MNTTKKILLSLTLAAAVLNAPAQTSDAVLRDRMTDAVMKVYDEQLAKDPNDYNTLFARAHQHYYNGAYTSALADVNQALLITPTTDSELRFDEYILRARISDARQDYQSELADLRMAQELQPKSLPCTDLIAKASLKAGKLDEAEKAFKTILRAESMNYDAMYGMAQVELARHNGDKAIDHVNKAVDLFRAEPQVYENRADIYARQGNIDAAVGDLLQGMTVGDGGHAVECLFALSDANYDAVMRSLADMGNKDLNNPMYRYLRGNIAMDHQRYGQALRDFNRLRSSNLYNSHSVYYNIAKCDLELCRYDEALTNVDQAIAMDPTQPEYFLVKALAEFNAGDGNNYDAAMETLNRCSLIAPTYVPMLLTKAQLLSAQGDDQKALGYLNAACGSEPDNAEALLSRGLLLKKMDNLRLAVNDFNMVTRIAGNDVYSLKGLALQELGRDNEALKWLQDISRANVSGGDNFYYAAVLMAMRGDNFKAMEYMQKAIDNGYGSKYALTADKLSFINLGSLRDEPQFPVMVEKAMPNFIEKD